MGFDDLSLTERPKKNGFYISKTAAIASVLVVVVLLVAEGLLVGLVGRPTCDNVVDDIAPKTTIPSKTTSKMPPTDASTTKFTTMPTSLPDAGGPDAPTDEEITNSRLPLSLTPIHYKVDLRPVLEKDVVTGMYIFYGSSSVQYNCTNSTGKVLLHSRNLNYTENSFVLYDETEGKELTIDSIEFFRPNEYLIIRTATPCVEGNTYNLTANEFQGELADDLNGIYRSEYDNIEGDHRVIAISQMETTGARQTFPCFDEPSFKATFDIILRFRTDLNYYAISNMPAMYYEATDIDGTEWNSTHFETTPIMSTYLLAVSVCDFEYEEAFTADGNIQTRIYARDIPVRNGEVTYASSVSPTILDVLATHFNVSYPLPKSDQMAVPDFGAGAMENWGLVLYREIYLLYDEVISSVYNKYSVTQVIGHELAHQWFGNLVTCEWWSEIWLNEGFATFVQYIAVDGVNSNWKTDELFVKDDLQVALYADDSSGSHALVHPQGYFSDISYSKGGSFLRMVEDFMGTTTFTNALINYLKGMAYSTATHDDLFQYWIDEADADGLLTDVPLQQVFESWTLQMGFPLLTVARTGTNAITVTQEYFLINPDDSPNYELAYPDYNYTWYVPFTYKGGSVISGSTHDTAWMMLEKEIQITTSEEYIIGNIDAKGIYRIQYHADMLGKIEEKLNSTTFTDISTQNRAQLIDDIFAISRSGRESVEVALELTKYLVQEIDYIPWTTFLDAITYFERILGRSVIYGDFADYVLSILVPSIYNHYGWDDIDTSDDVLVERMTRGLAIGAACEYGYQECIDNATDLYRQWMENSSFIISSTYRTDVLCAAIRAGGEAEWNYAWDQYLAVDSAQYKTDLRYAMSCSKDPWILNRYLEFVLDPDKVRQQDASRTLSYIGGQEYGKYVAWAFAFNNWDKMLSTVGSSATSSLLSAATRRFSTEFDLSLVESLREIAGVGWTGTFNSYTNTIRTNMAWREENEPKIANWLGVSVTAEGYKDTRKMSKISEIELLHPKALNKKY
ncbi:unnamed protein product [Clavelina lepadiformis]|uniref:Aminopeptidase n=1 Tax=Clavelina lepadiformis TaxID=159417 RepID=A0ABP0GNV5_CLALP